MKKLKQTYLRSGRVIGAVLLLLMIVGSIWDLPISKFLYPGRESSFGQFFAAFGELPAFLAMTSAGILLLFNRKRLRKSWNVLFIAASAVLVAGGIVLSIHEARDNVPAMPLWVAALVTVFAAALAGFLLLLGTEGCQTKTILRFILVLAFISIGMMIVINVIKIALIGKRHNNSLDARLVSRHSLFTETAYRQYFAAKSYLTCHSNVTAYFYIAQCRDDARYHGDTCRWTVLRHSTLGSVYMQIFFLVKVFIDAIFVSNASAIAYGNLCRLLHNVAK